MKDLQTVMEEVKESNVNALKDAGLLTLGKEVTNRLVKMAKPQLPIMARGYVETPWGKYVLANAVAGIIKMVVPDTNRKAHIIANAMLSASAYEAVDKSLNLEALIDKMTEGIQVPEVVESGTGTSESHLED